MTRRIVMIVVSCCIVSYGCNAVRRLTAFNNRPRDVVAKYYAFCNAREYSKVEGLLSAERKSWLGGAESESFTGTLQAACRSDSQDSTFIGLDIEKEELGTDKALVVADIHFENRSNDKAGKTVVLIKEQGVWRIAS